MRSFQKVWAAVLGAGVAVGNGCAEGPGLYDDERLMDDTVITGPAGAADRSAVYRRVDIDSEPVLIERRSMTTIAPTPVVERRTEVVTGPGVMVERSRPLTPVTERETLIVERGAVEPLTVTVSAPSSALICEDIPMRFIVANRTDVDAPDAHLRAALPVGLRTVDGRTSVDMNIGMVPANSEREVIVPVRADQAGTFRAMASVSPAAGITAPVTESEMVVGRPVLNLALEATEPGINADEVIVTLKVSNTGNVPAVQTVVEAILSPNARAIDRGGAAQGLDRLIWNMGDIGPYESKEVRLRIDTFEPGIVTGTATAVARCAELTNASFRKEVR